MKPIQALFVFVAVPAVLALSQGAIAGPEPRTAPGATMNNLNEAKALYDRGAKFADVRMEGTAEKQGRIRGSFELGTKYFNDAKLAKHAGKSDEIVFYCTDEGCANPYYAAEAAHAWGYKKLYQLREGFAGWEAKGLPVER
jgi:rhodanese-related sulfurtransferase